MISLIFVHQICKRYADENDKIQVNNQQPNKVKNGWNFA